MALFKKPKRPIRKRQTSFSSDEEEEDTEAVRSVLEEVKQMQRLRRRQRGVNVEDLTVGEVTQKEDKGKASKSHVDPSKLKTGGFVDLKTLKKELANADDVEQIGTTFAAETNRRDEDADMLQYVETELAKHKGIKEENETHDRRQKIKNIEQTEEAKQKLLAERQKKKDAGLKFFPKFNFYTNGINIDDSTPVVKKMHPAPKPAPLRVGDIEREPTLKERQKRKKPGEKATDDFYFERFRKQLRKY
ncbi:hypothetical protein LSH36_49g04050 [Paralvinella palmiformis]|uniref:Uncharacterized protein n=1 Tax=Paralvinella palmiformis TaxID=53620 RepID=A0AAD9NCQ8_9ANNE|nr:hypothetical protein LSH36_49g04050 [Paralvinella palmiformis]